jgi:hypothetical protein
MKKNDFFRSLLALLFVSTFFDVCCQTIANTVQEPQIGKNLSASKTSNSMKIYDQLVGEGFNHDTASIRTDNTFELIQEQSKSIKNSTSINGRTPGLLSISIADICKSTSQYISNGPMDFDLDGQYLVWGHNGEDLNGLAATIVTNISAGISPTLTTNVSFTPIQRIWKFAERHNGKTAPRIKISIPQNAINQITSPVDYFMLISNSSVFDSTVDSKLMVSDGNGNLTTEYVFDTTKYITFGYASRVVAERSIYFDGSDDYIDMENRLNLNPLEFTISAWIKRDTGAVNGSIISKRDALFTQGYDLKINNAGKLQMVWKKRADQSLTSITTIPENEWHHVAAIYNGITLSLYIDGVLDRSANLSGPLNTSESFYIGAGGNQTPNSFFRGNIDEVRLWNGALSVDQLRFIMNQEIENNVSFVSGKTLPINITKNEVANIPWNRLDAYYPMSEYTYTNIVDASGNGNIGTLRNINTVDLQTAPIPYKSINIGDWSSETTWLNGSVQTIPNDLSIVDGITAIDWNIVETNHNINIETDHVLGRQTTLLGLKVLSNKLTIKGINSDIPTGNGLIITHYLKLNGTIDLNGESQLIQTLGSDFDVNSFGTLERDQQGTADNFTYNYWSSPVGIGNTTTNNNSFKVKDVMRDGTNTINWLTSGYNGTNTSPVGIADYWIWKYANLPDNSYASWQHVRSTGTMRAAEGFTMKGPGSGSVADYKNYTFVGKPNNGNIDITLNADNDYLVGNPYPSAIDGRQFILDNSPINSGNGNTTGTLYFWEHWSGGTHSSSQYQGGYAMYNLSGGVPCASIGTNNPNLSTGGLPAKIPKRYIPVSQGFFVVAKNTVGTIKFRNSQRVFMKEGTQNSLFLRNLERSAISSNSILNGEDERMKFRIGFNSVNTIHRQLLLTIDENATEALDWGYDALYHENQIDDMYWMIDNEKFTIQGRNAINETSVIPLGLHLRDAGQHKITIDLLENVPNEVNIFVHDKILDYYHNLRQSDYAFNLPNGSYLDRFEITFRDASVLNVTENESNDLQLYFANESENLVLLNPTLLKVKRIEVFNIVGQKIQTITPLGTVAYSEYKVKNLSKGTYIVKLITDYLSLSKKVLVK